MTSIKTIISPVYHKVRNILLFPSEFYGYYKNQKPSEVQRKFAKELSAFRPNHKNSFQDGVLLIQYLKDYEYTIKFAAAAKTYAEKNNLSVSFYNVSWTKWIGWSHKYESLFGRFFKSGNDIIHESFAGDIIFRNEDKFHDQAFIKKQLIKIKTGLFSREDVLKIEFEGILTGDLIYDTYLRYFSRPTIEDIDENIITIIEIALNIFYNFKKMLAHTKIKALFNSYTAYIEHGIPARICLEQGIKVYTFGSYSYLIQECTKDFPYHSINHSLFSPDKKISAENLELAKQTFTARFKGVIDEATRYMKVSAFSEKPINEDLKKKFGEGKRNVVIYTHDFYDSPHINRCLQFPDLYQFLKQTLDAIKDCKNTNFYVKTHPNSYGDSKERTIALVKSQGNSFFHVLDDSVSNLHIINLRPDLIVTARGTVGAEMAHFGIPVVALYDNIYINFNFVHSCREIETYFKIIKGELQAKVDFEVQHIYSFYYQAYMEKAINEKDNAIVKLTTKDGDNHNDKYITNILNTGFSTWKNDLLNYFKNAINTL